MCPVLPLFRHMWEMLAAGREVYSEFKNLCVWNKRQHGQLLSQQARTNLRVAGGVVAPERLDTVRALRELR
jgi:hypothetical protein